VVNAPLSVILKIVPSLVAPPAEVLFLRVNVRAQNRVYARKVALALFLKPFERIAIDARMHRCFALRHHDPGPFPEITVKCAASGASDRVLLAPREIFLLIAPSEYLTVVFFCVTPACPF
jgi:hypothetical protein